MVHPEQCRRRARMKSTRFNKITKFVSIPLCSQPPLVLVTQEFERRFIEALRIPQRCAQAVGDVLDQRVRALQRQVHSVTEQQTP